ncbi:MAG: 6-phosphogluconolactonase [Nitratireductor sp.]
MNIEVHNDRDELARWLADHIAELLSDAIAKNGVASLAVSGGGTPKLLFVELSKHKIAWDKVTLTLVDERWVNADSDRSNAKLVYDLFKQNEASELNFLPLFHDDIDANAIETKRGLYEAITPFDVVILGMGTDGHTASFFPGGTTLAVAVDTQTKSLLIDIEAEGAGEPRVTFTLPPLVGAGETILHIEGQEKHDVLMQASKLSNADEMPIKHILNALPDLRVVWAA